MKSWVRATVGALKDAGNIWYAKLKSKVEDIDIAVLKSTRHDDIPPNENHFRIALSATESSELLPHLRHAVEMRLNRTKNWMVTLKTLALIHRLLRDAQIPIFTHEVERQHSSHETLLASISQHFEDSSSPLAQECSLWVRKYSSYLAQRLHCNRILKCADNIVAENQNRMISEDMETKELLEGLKSLQLLVGCLLECIPRDQSPVAKNSLIQFVLYLLIKECFNIYAAFNVCICKLLDEVPTEKAPCLVYVYKRILRESEEKLSEFYQRSCIVIAAHGVQTEKPSPESLSIQIKDYITKYRHRLFEMEDMGRLSIHIHSEDEEHDITKKKAADQRNLELQQDTAEETEQDNVAAGVSMSGVMEESFP